MHGDNGQASGAGTVGFDDDPCPELSAAKLQACLPWHVVRPEGWGTSDPGRWIGVVVPHLGDLLALVNKEDRGTLGIF